MNQDPVGILGTIRESWNGVSGDLLFRQTTSWGRVEVLADCIAVREPFELITVVRRATSDTEGSAVQAYGRTDGVYWSVVEGRHEQLNRGERDGVFGLPQMLEPQSSGLLQGLSTLTVLPQPDPDGHRVRFAGSPTSTAASALFGVYFHGADRYVMDVDLRHGIIVKVEASIDGRICQYQELRFRSIH